MFQSIIQIVKKVILLIIPNGKYWYYLAVKELSALLRRITSKIIVILIVWIVSIPIEQKANLNRIKNVCENTEFCNVIMSSEDAKIL